ncbi:hypothetical protein BaRGS_00029890 [Batillaria attramentaria]|uniref:Uncharacterized protein n=1 Tax=Batillaria attramentaria TaxID=370345 RepID=A0ABD0JV07_9CAEN
MALTVFLDVDVVYTMNLSSGDTGLTVIGPFGRVLDAKFSSCCCCFFSSSATLDAVADTTDGNPFQNTTVVYVSQQQNVTQPKTFSLDIV